MAVSIIPFWKRAPFVRLLIPFIAGIVAGYYCRIPMPVCQGLAVTLLGVAVCWGILPLRLRFAGRSMQGLLLQALVLSAGLLITRGRDPTSTLAKINCLTGSNPVFVVRINDDPVERMSTWKTEGVVLSIQSAGKSIRPQTKMLLYFRKPFNGSLPGQGDLLWFQAKVEPITNTQASGGFDFKQYCALQNIHHQAFLRDGQVRWAAQGHLTTLESLLRNIKHYVTGLIKRYIRGIKEAGLAEALLIGYKNDLDKSLLSSYAVAGVVHVIAISGLHLGFIYMMLKKCSIVFGNKKAGKWFSAIFILCGLWLFSLLAGASPSILRSAVMFSALVTGGIFGRRAGMENGLAASAFILLWCNPYWLWDLGFQLSYGALTGIMVFAKPIYQALTFKWKIADQVWKLNSVTLSAQVLTTPVSIYYFHQFPLLFMVTNFIAVPLSSVVLVGEIILCATAFSQPIASLTGKCVRFLIYCMNEPIEFFARLPFATIKQLELLLPQVYISYIFIFFFAAWLIKKDKRLLPPALIAAIFFFIAGW